MSGSGATTKLEDEILSNPERTASLLMTLLINDTAPTIISDTTEVELRAWQIVLIGMGAAIGLLALLSVAWLCVYCYKCKTRWLYNYIE